MAFCRFSNRLPTSNWYGRLNRPVILLGWRAEFGGGTNIGTNTVSIVGRSEKVRWAI